MEFVIIAGTFALLIFLVIKFGSRSSSVRTPPHRRQPTNPDQGFLQGYVLGNLLNQPVDAQQPNPDSPHASSPTPQASEIHHTFPDHSPSIDTSSHSQDSGSFDSGSSHGDTKSHASQPEPQIVI